MKYIDKIRVLYYWTDQISNQAVNDFIYVQEKVFKFDFNISKFKKKYIENIFGPSLISLAYLEDKCVGARAFWRNDLNGVKAYQPCDTAVLSKYRGRGIFGKMTKVALNQINKNTYIYNFPNDNSLEAYKKLGWKISYRKKYKFFYSKNDIKHIDKINAIYLDWLFSSSHNINNLYYSHIKNNYYLLKKRKYNLYLIIGEIDKPYTYHLPRAKYPIHLVYSPKGYLGRGVVFATKNMPDDIKIPLYKMDTLF